MRLEEPELAERGLEGSKRAGPRPKAPEPVEARPQAPRPAGLRPKAPRPAALGREAPGPEDPRPQAPKREGVAKVEAVLEGEVPGAKDRQQSSTARGEFRW